MLAYGHAGIRRETDATQLGDELDLGEKALRLAGELTIGLGLFYASLKQPLTRRLVAPLLPKPGTGPSLQKMDNGWFRCDLFAFATDGRRLRGVIQHAGDPGNRATVKFVSEAALALALNADRLPGGSRRGGVLTPATGLGQVLVDRLQTAGLIIDIGQPTPNGAITAVA